MQKSDESREKEGSKGVDLSEEERSDKEEVSDESSEEDGDGVGLPYESSEEEGSDESYEEDGRGVDLPNESSEEDGHGVDLPNEFPGEEGSKDVAGLALFKKNYKKMDQAKKWTIDDYGIVFEDRLYRKLAKESKFHETSTLASFFVTLEDQKVQDKLRACFGSDTPRILAEVQPTIEDLPSDMESFMQQFYRKDQKQIKQLLVDCQIQEMQGSLPVKSYWLDWLNICLTKFFLTCPSLKNPPWSEHWYSANFWGVVVDTIFQQIEGATVHR